MFGKLLDFLVIHRERVLQRKRVSQYRGHFHANGNIFEESSENKNEMKEELSCGQRKRFKNYQRFDNCARFYWRRSKLLVVDLYSFFFFLSFFLSFFFAPFASSCVSTLTDIHPKLRLYNFFYRSDKNG